MDTLLVPTSLTYGDSDQREQLAQAEVSSKYFLYAMPVSTMREGRNDKSG